MNEPVSSSSFNLAGELHLERLPNGGCALVHTVGGVVVYRQQFRADKAVTVVVVVSDGVTP